MQTKITAKILSEKIYFLLFKFTIIKYLLSKFSILSILGVKIKINAYKVNEQKCTLYLLNKTV